MSDYAWPADPSQCALYGNRLHLCPGEKCHRYTKCPAVKPEEVQ